MSKEQKEYVDALWDGIDEESKKSVEVKVRHCLFEQVEEPPHIDCAYRAAQAVLVEFWRIIPNHLQRSISLDALGDDGKKQPYVEIWSMFPSTPHLYFRLYFETKRGEHGVFHASLLNGNTIEKMVDSEPMTNVLDRDWVSFPYDHGRQRFYVKGSPKNSLPMPTLASMMNNLIFQQRSA